MTKIAILPEGSERGARTYRAVAGEKQSVGKTAGAALDALTQQLGEEAGLLIIVQNQRPDRFFGGEQRHRLEELMARWRDARDAGTTLSAEEQAELHRLVDEEVRASGDRAASWADEAGL